MTSPNYQILLSEMTLIANKYSLGQMLVGFTPDLINLLMHNNIDKIKMADSYDTAVALINASLSDQLGAGMDVSKFITADSDRVLLYSMFAKWRTLLLSTTGV